MPTKKTTTSKKRQPAASAPSQPASLLERIRQKALVPTRDRVRRLLDRRPHRSFKRTRRRDYTRSLKLPGYWVFTNNVRKAIWQNWRLFLGMSIAYASLTVLLVGLASQDSYAEISDLLQQTSGEVFQGHWGALGEAGLLLASGITGQYNVALTEAQQIYAVVLILFTWLTSVWMLRAILGGRKPKLRDALYNAGAPILPTAMIALLFIVQLLPIVAVVLGFIALVPFGIVDGGAEAMLFWVAASLLILLSLYWVTSTLIAMVVVTLPGMYPMQAIRAAGDLVVGRRVRILLRLLWLLFVTLLFWAIVMVPAIGFDAWLKGLVPSVAWLPIVPVALLILSTLTVVWVSSYIYLLYRRIVDDDAAPA